MPSLTSKHNYHRRLTFSLSKITKVFTPSSQIMSSILVKSGRVEHRFDPARSYEYQLFDNGDGFCFFAVSYDPSKGWVRNGAFYSSVDLALETAKEMESAATQDGYGPFFAMGVKGVAKMTLTWSNGEWPGFTPIEKVTRTSFVNFALITEGTLTPSRTAM